jgi:hypothetical protein
MSTMKIRAAAIKAIEDEAGRVTAEALVLAARDQTHPLHKEFPWDDKKAAHQHRLDVARRIIASVRVTITTTTKKVTCVGYVRDPEAGLRQGYVSTVKLRTEADAAREALGAEIARVQSILERAKELAAGLELDEDFQLSLAGALDFSSRMRKGLGFPGDGRALQ